MVTFFFGFAVSIAVSLTINNIFLYSRQGVRSTNIKNILKPDLLVYITQLVGATFLLIHLLLKFYQFAFVQNNGYKDNCYSIKWSVFLTAPVFVMAMNVILIWRISILLPSRFQLAAKVALTLAQLVVKPIHYSCFM